MKTLSAGFCAAILVLCTLQSNARVIGPNDEDKKLTDLPMELLLVIFEDLELNDLTGIARSHPYTWDAADMIFRNKFAAETIDVNGYSAYSVNSSNPDEFQALLNTLEAFGHLVKKINLNYAQLSDEQREKLNQFISKYAADSLIEIELRGCNDTTLSGLTTPFTKAEKVSLSGSGLNSSDINLSELFPAVRSLNSIYLDYLSPANIEQYFPHLEEIGLHKSAYEGFFQLNPQVKRLRVGEIDWSGLRAISELCPELERFSYRGYGNIPFEGDDIHFENLKAFISESYFELPRKMERLPIVFGNLEEIECDAIDVYRWLHTILQNKNLRKITIGKLGNSQYYRLFKELQNIEELIIDYVTYVPTDMDTFLGYIHDSKRVKKVGFCASMIGNQSPQPIINRLQGWDFVTQGNCFIFTRE